MSCFQTKRRPALQEGWRGLNDVHDSYTVRHSLVFLVPPRNFRLYEEIAAQFQVDGSVNGCRGPAFGQVKHIVRLI